MYPWTMWSGVLSGNKVRLINLEIKDNRIVGSNGSIERLPKLIDNQLAGKSPQIYTIITKNDRGN